MMYKLWTLSACMAVVLPLMAMAMEDVQMMEIEETDDEFIKFKKQYGKQYSPEEEMQRREVFYSNLLKIKEHNSKYPTEVSFYMAINQFADTTYVERLASKKVHHVQALNASNLCSTFLTPLNLELPKTVDWRTKGYVTPVKNDLNCYDCNFVFGPVGAVEGQYFRKTGTLLSLSEQELIDCCQPKRRICGLKAANVFEHIMLDTHGLETESQYPYTADTNATCKADRAKQKVSVTGCVKVPKADEVVLQQAVATVGPVAVLVDGMLDSFTFYKGGVYREPMCSSEFLSQGVLVVGYGSYQENEYWMVKNSFGTDWRMNGYIMMARNNFNMCGIASLAAYPIV